MVDTEPRKFPEYPYETRAAHYLGLPTDLTGKKILEPFSGAKMESLKELVEKRGGTYTSLDNHFRMYGGKHIKGDAWHLPFADGTFDFIIMNSPPLWWRRDNHPTGTTLQERVFPLITESLRVLRKKSGNTLSIGQNMSEKDILYLNQELPARIADFANSYDLRTASTGNHLFAVQVVRR